MIIPKQKKITKSKKRITSKEGPEYPGEGAAITSVAGFSSNPLNLGDSGYNDEELQIQEARGFASSPSLGHPDKFEIL